MEEAYRWLFVDQIPLLYDKRRVARQLQVEAWLDLTQVAKELGIEKAVKPNPDMNAPARYVV